MKQFILKEGPDKDGIIRLRGKDYHYLVKVRRLKPGAVFTALPPSSLKEHSALNNGVNNAENPVTVSVLSTDGHTLIGSVLPEGGLLPTGQPAVAGQPMVAIPPVILFQGIPKETRMDLIVRQAAEGGISKIVPFFAEYSIPKKQSRNLAPGKNHEAKTLPRVKRWERIIKEARQQSGSAIDTQIQAPLVKDELFDYWKKLLSETEGKALGLVFCLLSDKKPLAQGGFHGYLNREPPLIVLAVGPEGGFSAAELDCFINAGFKPVNMGEAILRTETAALYAAAAVKITLLEKAYWTLKNE